MSQNVPAALEGSAAGPRNGRLRAALPAPLTATLGSCLWGAATGTSALLSLLIEHWETPALVRWVGILYAAGGVIAFPLAWTIAASVAGDRPKQTAFAAMFVSLGSMTMGVTALLYVLQYRSYYAEWHADAFTLTWVVQFAVTTLVALYQFAVLGIRLYFPVGFVALAAASFWFARRSR